MSAAEKGSRTNPITEADLPFVVPADGMYWAGVWLVRRPPARPWKRNKHRYGR